MARIVSLLFSLAHYTDMTWNAVIVLTMYLIPFDHWIMVAVGFLDHLGFATRRLYLVLLSCLYVLANILYEAPLWEYYVYTLLHDKPEHVCRAI